MYARGEHGGIACTTHKTKHVCGFAECNEKVTDAWGMTSCAISGLVFSYGQCTESDTPDTAAAPDPNGAAPPPGPAIPRAPDVVRRAVSARRAVDAVRETCRNVVHVMLAEGAVQRYCRSNACAVPVADHLEAYVEECVRTWCDLEDAGRSSSPAVHALGVLLLMAKGECFASHPAKDALLDACLMSVTRLRGPLIKTNDGSKGKNATRSAMQTRPGARFRTHADVLKRIAEEKKQRDAALDRGDTLLLTGGPAPAADVVPTRSSLYA